MAKHLTSSQIKRIKSLRLRGHSLPEISNKLKIGKGTAWSYIQGVKMLPKFEKIWLNKRKGSIKLKENRELIALKKAKANIKSLSKKEKLLILSSLYWAEGAKVDFNLTNTDPNLITVFIKSLKEIFGVENDRLRINIRIYEDMNAEDCIYYWFKLTGLARTNLSSVNVLKGKKTGKLKYGMCRIRVTKGGDMLKYLVAVRKRLIELY